MTIIRTYISTFLLAICMFTAVVNQVNAVEIEIKESISENRYSFVSIVAIILTGPYHYFKRFFGSSVIVKPDIKQDVVLQESIKLIPNSNVMESVTVPLSDTTETVKLEQVSPIELVVDELEAQSIKVLNNHDQSLKISFSSLDEDDCVLHQFSVPSFSCGSIN